MKFIKGARNWRSIVGTQKMFWPLTPHPQAADPPPQTGGTHLKQRSAPAPRFLLLLRICKPPPPPTHDVKNTQTVTHTHTHARRNTFCWAVLKAVWTFRVFLRDRAASLRSGSSLNDTFVRWPTAQWCGMGSAGGARNERRGCKRLWEPRASCAESVWGGGGGGRAREPCRPL